MGLDVGKDFHRLFCSANFSKPARGAREERDPEHEAHGRDELDAPSCAEGGRAGDEGAAVAHEKHDEDAPFDGELLDHDDGTAFFFFGDLGEIHRDLGGGDSYADAVDKTTAYQHTVAIAGDLNGCAGKPEETCYEDGVAAADFVGERTSEEGAHH